MWAIPTGASWLLKKKNQVKSPSPESRVPETGSNPPIGSDRESGRDSETLESSLPTKETWLFNKVVYQRLSNELNYKTKIFCFAMTVFIHGI